MSKWEVLLPQRVPGGWECGTRIYWGEKKHKTSLHVRATGAQEGCGRPDSLNLIKAEGWLDAMDILTELTLLIPPPR